MLDFSNKDAAKGRSRNPTSKQGPSAQAKSQFPAAHSPPSLASKAQPALTPRPRGPQVAGGLWWPSATQGRTGSSTAPKPFTIHPTQPSATPTPVAARGQSAEFHNYLKLHRAAITPDVHHFPFPRTGSRRKADRDTNLTQ